MSLACQACGSQLDADARFCKHCGTAVDGAAPPEPSAAAPASDRERKVATLLFADIVGFTELGERLDAEVVNRLVSEAFERLAAEVERYGGTVEKFAGDAMLAVFGVPTTHEDDPERAVRAALEMQSVVSEAASAGETLRLRIGIETGEVLADIARSTEDRDLFVTGDAVNTASRLQAAADPGTVVVGPTAYASTRGLIEYEELEPKSLKGKRLPTSAWRAVRILTRRGGLRPSLGLEAPLIGRDEELSLLKETVRRSVAAGTPHLITVTGEAGIGKTRLIWELEKYLDGLPDVYHWRKGRCYSYASSSYSPLVETVKADASISEDDPPDVMASKLDGRLEQLPDADGDDVRRAMSTLLGLPTDPASQAELYDGWRTYLSSIATMHPLVLVLEDIHWADEATLDFIELLTRWGEGPIAVVCLARPELLERRPTWGGGIRNASLVELTRLDDDKATAMLEALLDGPLPGTLSERLVEVASGNPLFTEELVRMFMDQGVLRFVDGGWRFSGPLDEVEVPGSVQAVLAERLDELSATEKRAAQEASVIGRIFWDVVLASLRDAAVHEIDVELQELRRKEFVSPRSPSSLQHASEWSFHHVLVRDVAYESLPKADRARLHLGVAHWAERELAERIEEFAELVASHKSAALRYEEELRSGAADDPTLRSLRQEVLAAARRAVDRAAAVSDQPSAHRWQLVVIELAAELGLPAIERARLAMRFHKLTDGMLDSGDRLEVVQTACQLLEQEPALDADGRQLLGHLRTGLLQALYVVERKDEAWALARVAAGDLEPDRPSAARAAVLRAWSWTLWHDYEFEAARPLAEEAIAEATASGAEDVYRLALLESAVIDAFEDRLEPALERIEQCHRLAVQAGDQSLAQRALLNSAVIQQTYGFPLAGVIALLEQGADETRRIGAYGNLAFMLNNLTSAYHNAGRFEDMLVLAAENQDAALRAGNPHMIGSVHLHRAEASLSLGRRADASASFEQAQQTWTDDPQAVENLAILEAVLRFGDDPAAALRIVGDAARAADTADAVMNVARWTGRLTYRTRDRAALEGALALHRGATDGQGPARSIERRWLAALVEEDLDELGTLASEMDELGYVRIALEMRADEALMAARAGLDEGRTEALLERCAEIGFHPWLGSLPETRWITAEAVSAA